MSSRYSDDYESRKGIHSIDNKTDEICREKKNIWTYGEC